MRVNNNEFIGKEQIKTYEEIDGFEVIEQLLLYKGNEIAEPSKVVSKKLLDDMALVIYNLKVSSTNRLYVGLHLDKFYQRADLICDRGRVKVPVDIFERTEKVNDSFKTPEK